jgi:catechol 2,3-dioxygenase-like lactoylglutathione lyase family enzyme
LCDSLACGVAGDGFASHDHGAVRNTPEAPTALQRSPGAVQNVEVLSRNPSATFNPLIPVTSFLAIHHVQLAMPPGGEDDARRFYERTLGLAEIPKPATLAGRGGAWFQAGGVQLHLGREEEFRPAAKAHPAIHVTGLDDLAARCVAAGFAVTHDPDLPGFRRFYVSDPFGNRLEFLEADKG